MIQEDSDPGPVLSNYQQQLKGLSKQLVEQLSVNSPFQEIARHCASVLNEVRNSLLAQNETLLSFTVPLQNFRISVPQIYPTQAQQWADQVESIKKAFATQIAPVLKQFAVAFQALPPRLREVLIMLGQHGWFLDMQMSVPSLWQFEAALKEGRASEAEEMLEAHFEARLDEIEKSMYEMFPHRAHLLKSAFSAHRNQEYNLSIPVLLAQVDGICHELASRYLFIKSNNKPGTASYVDELVESEFWLSILSPLTTTLPINASASERTDGANALNRHTVMHGEALEYGTKANSLRAVSLLNYVSSVLRD